MTDSSLLLLQILWTHVWVFLPEMFSEVDLPGRRAHTWTGCRSCPTAPVDNRTTRHFPLCQKGNMKTDFKDLNV